MDLLKIGKITSKKSKIKQRPLMAQGILPKHSSVSIFCGSQGSGKTNLLVSLLLRKEFYGKKNSNSKKGYFDEIILFTNSDDDMYDDLIKKGIIKKHLIKFNPSADDIQMVVDHQNAIIQKAKDISKTPKVLIIFEDIVSSRVLMRSQAFLECFIRPRHLNFSVWLLTQYLNIVPKSLRMQANHVFAFRGNKLENAILEDHYTPPECCSKCFNMLIKDATTVEEGDSHPFLHVAKNQPVEKRFRRNLNVYLEPQCDHL